MGQPAKYQLAFNNFQFCASNAFRNLLTNPEFTDVTLACEEDVQIQAHKVILSSMSSFFYKILSRNHHQHPLIYLKGVKQTDLQSIINFIYTGEAEIENNDLDGFMKSATDLGITGLQTSEYEVNTKTGSRPCPQEQTSLNGVDQGKRYNKSLLRKDKDNKEPEKIKLEEEDTGTKGEEKLEIKIEMLDRKELGNADETDNDFILEGNCYTNLALDENLDDICESSSDNSKKGEELDSRVYNCDQCDYNTTFRSNHTRHVKKHSKEFAHDAMKFECELCHKKFNSKDALKYHNNAIHDGVRFPCSLCDYKATTQQGLKKHLKKHNLQLE